MKKGILTILAALLLAGLCACGGASPAETTVPETTVPETTVPETTACPHIWEAGACQRCGEECGHEWVDGHCTVCGAECAHDAHDPRTKLCLVCGMELPHEFVEEQCTRCSLKNSISVTTLPEELGLPCGNGGTIEKVTYSTYAYGVQTLAGLAEDAIPVEKYAYVYLPRDYDPEQAYNILYLLHGSGGSAETWFGLDQTEDPSNARIWYRRTRNLVDNLIASGEVNPLIIVTPSFYTFAPEEAGMGWLNNKLTLDDPAREGFARELPQLMQAVESQYATFAHGDTTLDGLHSSRAHRAFAGFSQGAVISYQSVLKHWLDCFGYLGSLSGAWTSFHVFTDALNENFPEEEILGWYHGEGTQDSAHGGHWDIYRQLRNTWPDRLNDKNCIMADKFGFGHDARNWYIDLYNMLHIFFL